jgi:copper transporter 1
LHLLQTVLHMVQVFVSYCLMLVFMLFNGWLCLAIVLGAGLGYNVLGWKRHQLQQPLAIDGEHCH